MMHDDEKSDGPVVPANHRNKAPQGAADDGEERGPAKGNPQRQNAHRTQSRESAHSALERVRQVAKSNRDAQFTALLHHVTVDRLREAYEGINPNAAPGVDGVTWSWYGQDVEAQLRDLHAWLHRGACRAKPSRRVYLPKAAGRQRPLGIAALEDKIVQAAVVEVMNTIYEEDFLGFSYGFRPRRGAHDALDALATGIRRKKVNWALDADIRGFFDAISQEWMSGFIKHRVGDPRILRLGILAEQVDSGDHHQGLSSKVCRGPHGWALGDSGFELVWRSRATAQGDRRHDVDELLSRHLPTIPHWDVP